MTTFNHKHLMRFADAWRVHRLSATAGEQFVQFAAYSIERWSQKWPPVSAEDMAEACRRLDNMQDHLMPLVHEFRKMHPAIRQGLYHYIGDGAENFAEETAERFELLYQAIGHQKMDFSVYNKDRDILRKRVLIGAIAKDFETCFKRAPMTTPDGPFMEVLGIVAEAVDTRLGKDVAAGVLRDLKAGQFWDAL